MSNLVPDSSVQGCCPPIVSASAAAPRAIAVHRSVSTAAELPACIRFSCCSPLASASAAALDCVRFNCFPIASASAAAPRLRPLQLCSRDGVRFVCCSPIASTSAAAPRQLFWKIRAMSTILQHSTQSSRFSKLKYEGRASL